MVLIWCSALSIVGDFLNFILQRMAGGTGPVIAGLKFGIFLALVSLVISRSSSWLLLLAISFLGSMRMASNLLHGDALYGTDFIFLFRFLLTVAFVLAFREIGLKGMVRMYRMAFVVLLVQSLVIIAAFVFQIHFFDAYEYREGYKGLFVHINDEAFMMAGGLLLSLQRFHERGDRSWGFLGLMLLLGMIVMGLGSRTALLGTLVVPMVYLGVTTARQPLHPSRSLFTLSFVLVTVSFAGMMIFWETIQKSIVNQLAILYASSGSILNAITTGRDVYIRLLLESLDGVSRYLFGSFIDVSVLRSQMMESDVFDLFFRFGIFIFPFLAIAVAMLYGPALRRGHTGIWSFLIIMILIGGLTGHVLISSQNSMWIAFFLTYFGRVWAIDPGMYNRRMR